MLDTFFYAFNAIAPMLFLMLLGYYLRYTHFFDLSLLKRMSTFTFRFGISAMISHRGPPSRAKSLKV